MELSKQVITLEQAKKLKELGIEQETRDYWMRSALGEWVVHQVDKRFFPQEYSADCYAAFTVAELGVMLPDEPVGYESPRQYRPYRQYYPHTRKDEWKWDNPFTDYKLETIVTASITEAEARADMLIHMLEKKLITASEVNARLAA